MAGFSKFFNSLWNNLDKLIFIPVTAVILSVIILYTGGLKMGIEFSGGSEITLIGDKAEIYDVLKDKYNNLIVREISSNNENWLVIDTTSEVDQSKLESILRENNITYKGLSVRTVGSSVSAGFFKEALIAILSAFVLMSIVIFIAFRIFIPSIAAILSVITDFIITLGVMSIIGIPLTFGSLAALLMLIGYSVDTDVLLSTRVLKNRDVSVKERFESSMKTGLTFSLASISAFLILIIMSSSEVLDQIASVVLIGLLVDIPSTWIQNTYILRKYVERRGFE